MRIYLTQTSDINSAFTSQDVISAYIAQKKENGYIINIGGNDVFARCLLDLNIGDFLKLKVTESSASQVVFKVVDHDTMESQNPPKPLTTLNIPHTQETQTAFNLLSKLNLPIKKERVTFIMDLLNQLIYEEKPKTLLSMKELPFQTLYSSFRKTLTKYINSELVLSRDQLVELLEDFAALEKNESYSYDKTLLSNRTKTEVIKEHLALNALNFLHDNDISFYALPIPIYHNIYLKISKDQSTENAQSSMRLSFIINTKNLGAILIDLIYVNGKVTASSTFEDKKSMDTVKKCLDRNKNNIHGLIKAMEFKVGKVSIKDFFLGKLEERPVTSGINLKV